MRSCRFAMLMLLLGSLIGYVTDAHAQVAAPPANAAAEENVAQENAANAIKVRRGEFRSVKLEQQPAEATRAWETRPYQVAVWVCHDGSPTLIEQEQAICRRIEINSQLLDPSGWNVVAGTPPSQWRWKLLQGDIDTESVETLLEDPELEFYDKLMIVRVRPTGGSYDIDVREIDGRTRQLGPAANANTGIPSLIGSIASRLLAQAFMPLTRIEQVSSSNKAEMRARGIESCVRTEINEQLEPEVVKNESSPCFIRRSDRLLPVVVRTDRGGNVVKLDAVPATYIAIESIENTTVLGQVFSAVRAPLAGRKSKRAEKLALVIRPADGTTVLRLVSRGAGKPEPLEGYDIVTVEPDDITKEKEYHGQTDWRGEIEVPSSDGMRMLLVRRGGRRLKKIPVIPGFLDEVETTITNDETRLLAKGVATGLQNEILSLAVLRSIYVEDIEEAIKEGDKAKARKILETYTELESARELKSRIADAEIRLKGKTVIAREKSAIANMFSPLSAIVSSSALKNIEGEIRQWIEAGKVPPKSEPESGKGASEAKQAGGTAEAGAETKTK